MKYMFERKAMLLDNLINRALTKKLLQSSIHILRLMYYFRERDKMKQTEKVVAITHLVWYAMGLVFLLNHKPGLCISNTQEIQIKTYKLQSSGKLIALVQRYYKHHELNGSPNTPQPC